MGNMSREELMNLIQSTHFTVIDLGLYLDTHPECPCGLQAFEEYNNMLNEAINVYERKFGPLTLCGTENDGSFDWVETSWPWQKGCDC